MASEQKATKKPLFYPLTHEEVLDLKDLTGVEIKVFLYVRTLDPFGDRNLEYSVTAVAEELGLSKGAVSKAIKSLDAKGFIHVELTRVKIRIKADTSDVASFPIGNNVSQSEPAFPIGNQDFPEETEVSYKKPEFPIGNDRQPEPLPEKASNSSQTNKTYSNFIQTLSDSERENFEKFVRDEWKKLTARNGESGEEIVSLERFLAREEDIRNWHQRFLSSAAGRAAKKKAIATSHDWRNNKRFSEWIWEAFNRGYEWVQEDEAEREQRKAFYDWAMATNAFEGVCL
ncbi:MAG: hypothetical protein N4J56_007305 [Chroococcidiopsis sp. SAG 2025]|uniref:MarR family transcriptional regulator n=1 Tax=Chroococcidiopsis sp. SAG 2025 TaxID=171389 RepID=UPI0029370C19|nr:helix-turn-helix domain-containing protein [Chroococcidiopsis sp. SAG 2025]MDV2997600.1 hypothetical protein [Chroococcidiopsis sp. SAG 2025]